MKFYFVLDLRVYRSVGHIYASRLKLELFLVIFFLMPRPPFTCKLFFLNLFLRYYYFVLYVKAFEIFKKLIFICIPHNV